MGVIVKKEIAQYFARNTPSTHSLLWCPQCGHMITPQRNNNDTNRLCSLCSSTLSNLSKETND